MRRLLLIGNSVSHGSGYLDHCADEMVEFLSQTEPSEETVKGVLFIPFAAHDCDSYAEKARQRFLAMGLSVDSIHEAKRPAQAIRNAQAFFVGGGNSFRLLKRLYGRLTGQKFEFHVAVPPPEVPITCRGNWTSATCFETCRAPSSGMTRFA